MSALLLLPHWVLVATELVAIVVVIYGVMCYPLIIWNRWDGLMFVVALAGLLFFDVLLGLHVPLDPDVLVAISRWMRLILAATFIWVPALAMRREKRLVKKCVKWKLD